MFKSSFLQFNGMKIVVLYVLSLLVSTSCTAHPASGTPTSESLQFQKDSVMRAAVTDSIYKIISEANKIKAEEITMVNDSTEKKQKSIVSVKSKDVSILLFILTSPNNYRGDVATYANFMPCFKVTFTKKKEECILFFDFGIKKWSVCDANGKTIKQFDLPSDDMLRIANILFPNNELYKKLINTDKR